MSATKTKYSLEEQLAVKNSIIQEFDFVERRVSQPWVDIVDATPDSKNPDQWDFLLYSQKHNCYVNLKFFPRITIDPIHTINYSYGIINYTKDTTVEKILWYLHNILDVKD